MPRSALALLAALALGCASAVPDSRGGRSVRGRDVSTVLATALDALGDLGAGSVVARSRPDGGVLTGRLRVTGPPADAYHVRVTVVSVGDEVRVGVTAEPVEAYPGSQDRTAAIVGEATPRAGCGCPGGEPLDFSSPSRDKSGPSRSRGASFTPTFRSSTTTSDEAGSCAGSA